MISVSGVIQVVTRQVLSLVLLLTQAATTFAGPVFMLCISPKGHVCLDAPWTDCTCCLDDCLPNQGDPCGGETGDEAGESAHGCACHCVGEGPALASMPTAPSEADSAVTQGQPCRCKHVPLIVAQGDQQAGVARAYGQVEYDFTQAHLATATSQFACFTRSRHIVALLPLPPPSGHLLAISCTILRC